ncbi:protoheme IX farnesyltransferase [Pseudobdellovibrio exovorus]|uniref:Protoheme IX farnesyltransferase n=1 Tax=Pseudobdellovibrio exovorus JSS TaxID=1184267 RepID=M4V5N6_9BACT|nr:protoheme IX farnesyltransferase [Pseudobdellovibrio exovorus]AGH94672.1 protoheme IX farnesyltransferase [Pseudobdellovibrio exovorus JSS]
MFKTYSSLTKFGIVIFVLLAGAAGYATGFQIENSFSIKHFLWFLGGLYFLSSGSLALNQVQEYKLDQKMPRTSKRPIASGKITPTAGLILSFTFLFVGINMLFELSSVAAYVGIASVALYNGVYTMYWKPKWRFAAVPGAIPGAFPVTIGYAVNNPDIFNSESIYLFLIMFLWQMPHFWTLAIKLADDYRLGGVPTLPVSLGVPKTLFHIGLYTFTYCGVAIASPFFLHTSWVYAALVFPFAFMLLKEFFRFYRSEGKERWLAFFMWTNISMLVFLFIPVIDKWSFLFIERV